jgi:hypothetical protein
MRLDRSADDGRQKYALIKWRAFKAHLKCTHCTQQVKDESAAAIELLVNRGIAEHGNDFFVLKYKDYFAKAAFRAYVKAVDDHVRWLEGKASDSPDYLMPLPPEEIERQLAELRPYLADLIVEMGRLQTIPHRIPT